jgi:hypothetical protein
VEGGEQGLLLVPGLKRGVLTILKHTGAPTRLA